MTRFEEALLQDVMTRLNQLGYESRLSIVHTVQAACAGSEHAQEILERRVGALIDAIQDNVLLMVKECLEYHSIGQSILCQIRDNFDAINVGKLTDAVIEEFINHG